jgi:cell division protein FtsB
MIRPRYVRFTPLDLSMAEEVISIYAGSVGLKRWEIRGKVRDLEDAYGDSSISWLPLNVLGRHFMETESLKREFLELLDKDLEFRYAVAGCLGLSEILKRLDSLAKEQVNLRKEQVKLGKEQVRLREEQTKIWNEIAKLREDMIAGFKRHDEILARHEEQLVKLREDMVAGFRRRDEEIAKLRSDMVQGFRRHDEELVKLREDFNRAYRQLDSRLSRVERTLEKMMLRRRLE